MRNSEKENLKGLIRRKKEAMSLLYFLTYSVKAILSLSFVLLLLSSFIWSLTECSFKKPLIKEQTYSYISSSVTISDFLKLCDHSLPHIKWDLGRKKVLDSRTSVAFRYPTHLFSPQFLYFLMEMRTNSFFIIHQFLVLFFVDKLCKIASYSSPCRKSA